jgi:hypothetical protein
MAGVSKLPLNGERDAFGAFFAMGSQRRRKMLDAACRKSYSGTRVPLRGAAGEVDVSASMAGVSKLPLNGEREHDARGIEQTRRGTLVPE